MTFENMRLMIVDDHPGMRKMIRQLVVRPGDRTAECASGDEALRTAQEFLPDVVTMDVRMPGSCGFETARALRRIHPEARIFMVTSYDQPFLRATAAEVGADGYVLKDNLSELRTLLGREPEPAPAEPVPPAAAPDLNGEPDSETPKTVRQELEQHRRLMEHSPDVVVETTREGVIRYISPNVRRALGYAPEELLGTSVFERIHVDDLLAAQAEFTQPEGNLTCRYQHRNGSWRWLETAGREFATPDGETLCALFARDVTDRRKSDEEMLQLATQHRHTQKLEALGALAGGVAHDFNNIICSVLAYAHLALMETQGQTEVQDYMQQVVGACDRAKALVQQILNFNGPSKNWRKPVHLQPLAVEVVDLLRPITPQAVELVLDLGCTECWVQADGSQMHQVLLNLCTNALHAMDQGPGEMIVRVAPFQVDEIFAANTPDLRPGPHVQISVSDTGHGMDSETISRIFAPFFTTKGPGKGTGLGLPVVQGIVRGHDGAIKVTSNVGLGTIFQVYLPMFEGEKKA